MKKNIKIIAKILIVDDEQNMRRALKSVLDNEPYEIEEAVNGLEGLDKIKKKVYDIIFLDIMMPDMSGIEVLEEIKKFNKKSAIIMISGRDNIDIVVESIKKGAFDYIQKPLALDRVLSSIRNALDKSPSLEELRFNNFNSFRFQQVILFYLNKNNISIGELSEKLKVSQTYLYDMLADDVKPNIEYALAIAKTLNIPFDLLINSSHISQNELEDYWDKSQEQSREFKLSLPYYLKKPIYQYLLAFDDFVRESKGEEIALEISEIEEGLLINNNFGETKIEEIKIWLNEYMGFVKQKISEFQVNFEVQRTNIEADILIAQLENQVGHLKNNLRITQLKLEYTQRENNLLIEHKDLLKEVSQLRLTPSKPDQRESKNELKDLLANGYCKKVIDILKKYLLENDDINHLYVVAAKYNNIIDSNEKGIISETDKMLGLQQVNVATLSLINKLAD